MPEIDDDLQGLLEELDIGPEISKEDEIPSLAPSAPPALTIPLPLPTIELPEPQGVKVLPLVPVLDDPDPPKEKPGTDLFEPEDSPDNLIDIREFIQRHDADYAEAKANLRTDRAKADELVRLLMARVEDGTASNQETEGAVQAVKCLVDSTGHMVRLLDSKTKFLAASKHSVGTIIQQNFKGGDSNLENILSQQIDDDEV